MPSKAPDLSKKDMDFLDNYRNSDGSRLTEAQRESLMDRIIRGRTLEIDGDETREQKEPSRTLYRKTPPDSKKGLASFQPPEVFILKYDAFGRELVRKVNEKFRGTKAEMDQELKKDQLIHSIYLLRRLALVTLLYENPALRRIAFPISPLQSERFMQQNRMPKDDEDLDYTENLALVLYDKEGANHMEARYLYESIKEHRQALGLSIDLEQRLLVVDAGLEVDDSFPHKIKPKVLPGITKVFAPEILKMAGRSDDPHFSYGLDNGLPSLSQLRGDRTLVLPISFDKPMRLQVLYRDGPKHLCADGDDYLAEVLADFDPSEYVTFAKVDNA